jgi:hypothetical protein
MGGWVMAAAVAATGEPTEMPASKIRLAAHSWLKAREGITNSACLTGKRQDESFALRVDFSSQSSKLSLLPASKNTHERF